MGPKSHLPSHLRSIRAICTIESMEFGTLLLHMGPKSQSLKHDMDAYMATLLGGEAMDLCWEVGRAKS